MSRNPSVAGMFYDSETSNLIDSIEECFLGQHGPGSLPKMNIERKGNIISLISPHAGFVYSGPAAAWAYYKLAQDGIPDIAIMLGPNHRSSGEIIAVSTDDKWHTPLGNVFIDSEITNIILEKSKYARPDNKAHIQEHSIEVQLPFLQYISQNKTKIAAISIAHLNLQDAEIASADLANAIAETIKDKSAVIIASTDMNHYENQNTTMKKDNLVLDKLLALDSKGMLEAVHNTPVSMCGSTAVAVAISASLKLGATKAEKLCYYTSGDITGDMDHVVGYASVAITK
ncbi:MAG: AmmeMemoRadiSam system protein B [Armatimonadota bacterium]